MPMGDTNLEDRYLRILAYGKDKTKKTWWALRCAELGYNVTLFDGDDGAHIIKQLPMEARKRILVMNLVDKLDRAVFMPFMVQALRANNSFAWDEQFKQTKMGLRDPAHSYVEVNPSKINDNDVLILDSWSRAGQVLVDAVRI